MDNHEIDKPVLCLAPDKLAHWTYTNDCKRRQTYRQISEIVYIKITMMPLLLQQQLSPRAEFCAIIICIIG